MRTRVCSEKRIAGAPPHITFLWLGALPKTDALMKAYVPKCVSLMLAIVKKYVIVEVTYSFCVLECCHSFLTAESIFRCSTVVSHLRIFSLQSISIGELSAYKAQSLLNIKYHSNTNKHSVKVNVCMYNIFTRYSAPLM